VTGDGQWHNGGCKEVISIVQLPYVKSASRGSAARRDRAA
jgi:hypothetical protein